MVPGSAGGVRYPQGGLLDGRSIPPRGRSCRVGGGRPELVCGRACGVCVRETPGVRSRWMAGLEGRRVPAHLWAEQLSVRRTEVCGATWDVSQHACENPAGTPWESVRPCRAAALCQWDRPLLCLSPCPGTTRTLRTPESHSA